LTIIRIGTRTLCENSPPFAGGAFGPERVGAGRSEARTDRFSSIDAEESHAEAGDSQPSRKRKIVSPCTLALKDLPHQVASQRARGGGGMTRLITRCARGRTGRIAAIKLDDLPRGSRVGTSSHAGGQLLSDPISRWPGAARRCPRLKKVDEGRVHAAIPSPRGRAAPAGRRTSIKSYLDAPAWRGAEVPSRCRRVDDDRIGRWRKP
jgi:hypothetical protein